MKIIDFETIKELMITPDECMNWVRTSFEKKHLCTLPSKISIKIPDNIFFNTMPAYIPEINRFGVKVISRFPNRNPSLQGDILLFDSLTGKNLALLDGAWITAMRTGAVAALSIDLLQKENVENYAFIGLGNTARATLMCMLAMYKNKKIKVSLLSYKNQTSLFIERFKEHKNIEFRIYNSVDKLIKDADVLVSCVTATNENFSIDSSYKKGILVVPVHTMGFQNCDLFFDKIYADDTNHVKGFKFFNNFKNFDELSKIITGENKGRESEKERILAYNIGIALHDIFFASKIYDLLSKTSNELMLFSNKEKFWI